jgi:hypothetical protein
MLLSEIMLRFRDKINSLFIKEEKLWLVTTCFHLGGTAARREFIRHYEIVNRRTGEFQGQADNVEK